MKRIVVIDDEADNGILFNYVFRNEIQEGLIDLKFYSSSTDALSYLLAEGRDTEMVFTDLNMPVLDGFGLIEALIKNGHKSKTYIVSAYSDSNSINKAKDFGVIKFIKKPINFEIIRAIIGV